MELASGTGKGRNTTEFTIAKRAVFAAMQTEKVRKTVKANPLARHRERTEYFRSNRNASMICLPRRGIRYQPPPGHAATCHAVRREQAKCSTVSTPCNLRVALERRCPALFL